MTVSLSGIILKDTVSSVSAPTGAFFRSDPYEHDPVSRLSRQLFYAFPKEGVMTESAKEYISEYRALQEEIRELEERLICLREQTETVSSPSVAERPGGGPRRDLADDIAALTELETSYRHTLIKARVRCARIEHMILSLPSLRQQRLLRARYVDGLSWAEIEDRLALSRSTVFDVHKKAISCLNERYGFDGQTGETPLRD